MKTYNVNVCLMAVKAAYVTVDLSFDRWAMKGEEPREAIDIYKRNWLSISNHYRETESILNLRNFHDNNLAEVVLDIDGTTLEEAVSFCNQFGKVVSSREAVALVQELGELFTNEYGDVDIFIEN